MAIEKKEFSYENYIAKTEEERKAEIAKSLEFAKEKKVLLEKIDKDKKLAYLRSMVERWLIKLSTVEQIIIWEKLTSEEIKEIFDKIDEIEEIKDIDEILPKNLRITKDEYMRALDDIQFIQKIILRIDSSLSYLFQSNKPFASWIMSLFSWLIHSLDHSQDNLIKIQENTIDIKLSLR